jgi:proline dehydrogenase
MDTLFDNTFIAFQSKSKKNLLKAYWLFRFMSWNKLTKIGTYFVKIALWAPLGAKKIIKNTLYQQFCGGETLAECEQTISELAKYGLSAIPDYVAEGQEDSTSFDEATRQILKTIAMAEQNSSVSFAVFKVSALVPLSVLAKKQAGLDLSSKDLSDWNDLQRRFALIVTSACNANVAVMVDAEETWIQNVVDDLVVDAMVRYNGDKARVYITCQMYRKDMLNRLKELVDKGKQKGFIPGVKLVRGAYLEKENERAMKLTYATPIHECKEHTDAAFDAALAFCLQEEISLCIGTHNEVSVLKAIKLMIVKGIVSSSEKVCFAQLYGMSDHISFNLAKQGFRVAKYLPFGPMELSLPYLFRRANENKSVAGQVSREFSLIKKELERRAKLS